METFLLHCTFICTRNYESIELNLQNLLMIISRLPVPITNVRQIFRIISLSYFFFLIQQYLCLNTHLCLNPN